MAYKKDMLQEAMEAGQKGDLARARELLRKLIEKNDKEALYWLLLSTVVESRDERVESLKNVLALEPNNSAAVQDLKLLGVPLPSKTKSSKKQKNGSSPSDQKVAVPEIKQEEENSSQDDGWSAGQFFGALTLLILGYLAAIGGASISTTDSSNGTSISQISVTIEAPPVQPGPGDFLEIPLTPTALYINTPHPETPSFQRGLQAYQEGTWLEAIEQFESYLAIETTAVDALYYLGLSYLEMGDIGFAKSAFEQSIALNPQFAPAYLGRVRAELKLSSDYSKLINDLNTALLLDPNFTEAYLARARYYLERNEGQLALADINRAELLSPLSPMVHAHKAIALSEIGNYELALPAAQLAYSLDITILSNYPVLANAFLEMDQASEAIEILQHYLTFEEADAKNWQLLGLSYKKNGEELSALGAFNQALELDPDLPQAAFYLGINELENGDDENALSLFRSAARTAPAWFEARIALAQALLKDGERDEAFLEVNFSRELAETDGQFAELFFWRATILESLGQEESAQRDWINLLGLSADVVPEEWRLIAEQRTETQ